MRKILFVTFVVFVVSCQKKDVGAIGEELSPSKYSLNSHIEDSLISNWNEVLRQNKLNTTIYELKIIQDKDITTHKEFYGILGTTNGDSTRVMSEVVLTDGKFYFPKTETNMTVICHGTTDCHPKMSDGKWLCGDKAAAKTCTACQKTVVASVNE
jgi:hypothetical protein